MIYNYYYAVYFHFRYGFLRDNSRGERIQLNKFVALDLFHFFIVSQRNSSVIFVSDMVCESADFQPEVLDGCIETLDGTLQDLDTLCTRYKLLSKT